MPAEMTSEKPRVKLSRRRVLEAALKIMDTEGIDAVTMRRVARELGVEAMSLYNHVEDKEAIFAGICETVLSGFEIPARGGDWMQDGRAIAHSFRAMLRAHPNVITLISGQKHPLTSVDALRPMDAALRCLRRSGLDDRQVARAYRTFGGFIFGFVLMEVGQAIAAPAGANTMRAAEEIVAGLHGDLPAFVELLPEIIGCDPDADFEFGLDLLMAGLQALASGGPAA